MRVVITGGCGFLGQLLGREILRRGRLTTHAITGAETSAAVKEVLLADALQPAQMLFNSLKSDAQVVIGDVADAGYCKALVSGADGPVSVFHLGAIMSGDGEADFDRCMDVNLHGTMHLLEAARHCGAPRPRFVMASAGATLGSGAPTDFVTKDDIVSDATRATPHTTYGMTKACTELLLSDYSRRGFVDGRACRLPSVVVRAGAPNAATTGCFSSVVREPLAGNDVVAPIEPTVRHAVTSHRTAIDALLTLHELDSAKVDAALGFDRTVFVPSTAVSLADMEAALRRVVAPSSHSALGQVTYQPDEKLSAAVASFPTKVDASRAVALGMVPSLDAEGMVRAYMEDFPEAIAPSIKPAPQPAPRLTAAEAAAAGGPPLSVALITGGGTGIGRAVALRLADGGWERDGTTRALVLTGRRADVLEETAQAVCEEHGDAVHVLVHPADLTRPADVESLFGAISTEFGRLDVLFNNAGAGYPPTPLSLIHI